MIRIK